MIGFIPILYNLLKLGYEAGTSIGTGAGEAVENGTDPVAGISEAWDAFIEKQKESIRGWFRAQAYGAMDISLIVMGVSLIGIATVIAANKDIMGGAQSAIVDAAKQAAKDA